MVGGGALGGGSSSVMVERGAERAVHAWRSSQQSSLLCRSLNFTVTLTLWGGDTVPHVLLLAEVLLSVQSWRPPVRTSRSPLQRVGCS